MFMAINPWLKALPVGFVAFCIACSQGVYSAVLMATIAWLLSGWIFSNDQRQFEAKLLNRGRIYQMDVEQAFARIQRALSNLWLGESYWHLRASDLASGYMLFVYEWSEDDSQGYWVRYHANLEVECADCSDDSGSRTLVKFSFDGLPNPWNKTVFYEAVHLVMGAIDAHLPEHSVVGATASDRTPYLDREMTRR